MQFNSAAYKNIIIIATSFFLHTQSEADVDSVDLHIQSSTEVLYDFDCSFMGSPDIIEQFFHPQVLQASRGYHVFGTLCLAANTTYTVTVEYTQINAGSQEWLMDSVSSLIFLSPVVVGRSNEKTNRLFPSFSFFYCQTSGVSVHTLLNKLYKDRKACLKTVFLAPWSRVE